MTTSRDISRKPEKKQSKLPLLLISVVLILAFLQIIFANRLTETGRVLQRLEEEAGKLEKENQKLANEIAAQGSLGELKDKVEKLGFVQNPSVLQLTQEKEVALNF